MNNPGGKTENLLATEHIVNDNSQPPRRPRKGPRAARTSFKSIVDRGMPDFHELENLYLVLVFIVPGVVALFVRSKLTTGRSPSFKENLMSFLVLSLVYYSLIVIFIEQALSVREPWLARAGVWILLILVGPAAFGLAIGIAAQKDWGNWLANKFGISFVHVIPAAWDWRFSKAPRSGMFIMVTLETGEAAAGFFGASSIKSSTPSKRRRRAIRASQRCGGKFWSECVNYFTQCLTQSCNLQRSRTSGWKAGDA